MKGLPLHEALRGAARELSGMEDAALSAELLLCRALSCDRAALIRLRDTPLLPDAASAFAALVAKRKRGMPVAYILGEKEFFSLPFYVGPDVLIPRPETEDLVAAALEILKKGALKMCDVGTGSGIVAVTVKKHAPSAEVTGVDFSEAALSVARKNGERHGVRVEWVRSDLLGTARGTYDLITANLPYIPSADVETLSPEVKDHEPRLALDGGADGLDLIRRLAAQAPAHLSAGGSLLLEIGAGQAEAVTRLLETSGFSVEKIRKDLSGIPRVVQSRRKDGA